MTLELPEAQTIIDNSDCLHSEAEVLAALDRMAVEMTADLQYANPIVYTVMNGGLIVSGHLLPRLRFPLEVSYMHATRYRKETSGGVLDWKVKPQESMKGRVVVIVDDILDEGHTLAAILEYCREQGAKEVRVAVLIDKKHDRKAVGVTADYVGLQVEDRFLFGCGMDYQGYWRNTLAIYAVHGM
ncbi:hypoxanthine-guanine phosphoribosyltransferase [Iodobacter fluviatilis]|uniref:Hypoxanthine phosphoribosyltransferase n=1 Tax=Iodobacter fluviatilis TaxID=537 RepID=A0A377Q9U8_9NEIS|nr:hypoxanthine-guanine phosphoribosyltransferase [Iodobacter fluviatilis]TCU88580.1 hypoxanthine phosphoribosyltransferase [Iodobacter fluviatilis]STQ91349.1 Hypoxanthine-guanine phosphoribosyltransferase [Iodobacter fluviatilis]